MVKIIISTFALLSVNAFAIEHEFKGLIDARLVSVSDESTSYIEGGYGKYNNSADTQLTLSQLGLQYTAKWENNINVHVVANAYLDGINNGIGLTEAFISYKSLPNQTGWRIK